MKGLSALVIAVSGCLSAGAATANPVKSLYTTVDLRACKKLQRHPAVRAWRCSGLAGIPVYVASGDLRQFVSVGADADKRRAATQTLGAANSIFSRGDHEINRDLVSASRGSPLRAFGIADDALAPKRRIELEHRLPITVATHIPPSCELGGAFAALG